MLKEAAIKKLKIGGRAGLGPGSITDWLVSLGLLAKMSLIRISKGLIKFYGF